MFDNVLYTFEIPDKNVLDVVEPRSLEVNNETSVLNKALRKPVDSPVLNKFLVESCRVGVVINDATRPTPTFKVLQAVYDQLRKKRVKVFVATGIHRKPTEEEYKFFLGLLYDKLRNKTFPHDTVDTSKLVFLGGTSKGTKVFLNKEVLENDALIVINSVEPHYFAGFTGGRKSLVPGVAGYETIEMNHRHALEKGAEPLRLKGNPVNEDLEECLRIIRKEINIFAVNMVLNRDKRIYRACAGDIEKTFYGMVKEAEKVYCVKVKGKADVVVTVASSPFNINLYQSQKAIENARLVVKEGGIIILVSSCREGIGPNSFYDLLSSSSSFHEVLEKVRENYVLGYHKAAKLASLGLKTEIWAVTKLPKEKLDKVHVKSFKDLQEAVNKALEVKGDDATFLVLKDGALTTPIPSKK